MPSTDDDQTFIYRHHFLHMLWEGFPRYFLTVDYNQQRALHNYFRPSEELTDEQLVEHRLTMKTTAPELAASAGKAYRALERVYLKVCKEAAGDPERVIVLLHQYQHVTYGSPDKKGRRIGVSGLARPQIDVKRLAKALLEVAKQMAADEAAAKAKTEQDETPKAA